MKATEVLQKTGEIRGCGAATVDMITQLLSTDEVPVQMAILEKLADVGYHINLTANELRASIEAEQALGDIE